MTWPAVGARVRRDLRGGRRTARPDAATGRRPRGRSVAERPLLPGQPRAPRRHHGPARDLAARGRTGPGPRRSATAPTTSRGRCSSTWRMRAELGWGAVEASAWRSLRFLGEAFDPAERRFRNFRGADEGWSRSEPSEDSQGRAAAGAGHRAGPGRRPAPRRPGAWTCSRPRCPAPARLARPPRDRIVGAGVRRRAGQRRARRRAPRRDGDRARAPRGACCAHAFATTGDHGSDWPWPEPVLTYENALLPRALIVAGRRLGDAALERTGLAVLDWLIDVQAADDGAFSPIGNDGWWRAGRPRAAASTSSPSRRPR